MKKETHQIMEARQRLAEGPRWRWKLAQQLAAGRPTRRDPRGDQAVRAAVAYLRCRARTGDGAVRAAKQYPLIAAAEQLANDASLSDPLKVLVLANCPLPEIAVRFSIPEDRIRLWEELFFHVRAALPAIDWVYTKIIQPERQFGSRALAAQMKMAYAGGLVVAQAILTCAAGSFRTPAEKLFDRRLQLHLKSDQALDMPLATNNDSFRFVKFHAGMKLKEKQLELEKQKLELRCREALRKHELALQRLQLARERERQRAEARALQAAKRAATKQMQSHGPDPLTSMPLYPEPGLAGGQAVCGQAAASPGSPLIGRWSGNVNMNGVSTRTVVGVEGPFDEPMILYLSWDCTRDVTRPDDRGTRPLDSIGQPAQVDASCLLLMGAIT